MKRLTRIFVFTAFLALITACVEEVFSPVTPEGDPVTIISASVEPGVSTKTTLQDGSVVLWTATDAISLLASGGVNYQFSTSAENLTDGGLRAKFSHNGEIEQQDYFALYPYSASASFNGTSVVTELPSVQTATAGSFGPGANLAVAYAPWGQTFQFRNAVAMINISYKTTDTNARIRKITIRSLDENILLSGSVALTPTVSNGAVTDIALSVTSGVPYASIEAPSGSYLSPDTDYYIAVAPVTLSSGYQIEFETADGLTFTKVYNGGNNRAALTRNLISSTGRKNLDNYEISGYFRVRHTDNIATGEYLLVYKMPDGSYRIMNEERTDTYIVKGTHFELSGTNMVSDAAYKRAQMEGMVAYVFRNAWFSSTVEADNISFASDGLILSPDDIGITLESYEYGTASNKKTYYYANINLYNRNATDVANGHGQIMLTLDQLAYNLNDSDVGTLSGKFNTRSASTNPGGNPNTCSDLVNALLLHATFAVGPIDMTSSVKSTAINQLKGDDNAFTCAFTTAVHTTKNNIVCQNHFMIKTADLLSGAVLSDIRLYKYGTKSYSYFVSNNY